MSITAALGAAGTAIKIIRAVKARKFHPKSGPTARQYADVQREFDIAEAEMRNAHAAAELAIARQEDLAEAARDAADDENISPLIRSALATHRALRTARRAGLL